MSWKLDATMNPQQFGMKIQAILMMNPDVEFVMMRKSDVVEIKEVTES